MTNTKIWHGAPPVPFCDICGQEFTAEWVDDKTKFGLWANMCADCDTHFGTGIGTRFVFSGPQFN